MRKIFGREVLLISIQRSSVVKVTTMNHILEVQYLKYRNSRQTIKKLNEFEYLDLSTGEVKEFVTKSDSRSDNKNSLSKSFRKARNLIRNNFTGGYDELMLTLTYRENMTDLKRLYSDFIRFKKKLCYHHGSFEYLNFVEPQGRGAWHMHSLLKFDDSIVLDNNSTVWKYWGHGFTRTKRLKDIDDIGAYLTSYLTDMPVEDIEKLPLSEISQMRGIEIEKEDMEGNLKRYVKGARLSLYPAKTQLFRKSKGIHYPQTDLLTYEKAKKKYSLGNPSYGPKEYMFELDEERTQVVIYEQYNTKR